MDDSRSLRSASPSSLSLYPVFVILICERNGVAGFTATLLRFLFLKQHLSERIERCWQVAPVSFLNIPSDNTILFIIFSGSAAQRGLRPPRSQGFLITHDAPQSVGLLWTSDQLVVETCTWQHTTHITDKHPLPRWDSNPRSQQTSGCRPRGHWDRR
jgi:hypothetical protein